LRIHVKSRGVSARSLIIVIAMGLGLPASPLKAAPSWRSRLHSLFSQCPRDMRALVPRGSEYRPVEIEGGHWVLDTDKFLLELDPQTKLYLRLYEFPSDEYDQTIFVANAAPGEGFVRFGINEDWQTLEIGLMAGMQERPGTGAEMLKLLIQVFPDYRIHARLDFVNLKRFQKLISSVLQNNRSIDDLSVLPIEDVPYLKSLSENSRDFSIQILNYSELHVFSEPISQKLQLDLMNRLSHPRGLVSNTHGRWLNVSSFLEEVILGKHPGFLLSPN